MMLTVDGIKALLEQYSKEDQKQIFSYLRKKFPIHPLEKELNTTAEVILEAIARANDLTLRGVRGIIAEAAFKEEIVNHLSGWKEEPIQADSAFDFKLADKTGAVRIQVKMQRKEKGEPKIFSCGRNFGKSNKYVVETQRTRSGRKKSKDDKTEIATRPYRFGEFDVLAVSMHPSTCNWKEFLYTVADWLLPREENPDLLAVYQPVSKTSDDDWTDDLNECIKWFRSGKKKKIRKGNEEPNLV